MEQTHIRVAVYKLRSDQDLRGRAHPDQSAVLAEAPDDLDIYTGTPAELESLAFNLEQGPTGSEPRYYNLRLAEALRNAILDASLRRADMATQGFDTDA